MMATSSRYLFIIATTLRAGSNLTNSLFSLFSAPGLPLSSASVSFVEMGGTPPCRTPRDTSSGMLTRSRGEHGGGESEEVKLLARLSTSVDRSGVEGVCQIDERRTTGNPSSL
jgi:hypothetical protein